MRLYSLLVFSISFLVLSSCEDVVDCIINRVPELSKNSLTEAQEGSYYSEKISAGIKNEPADDNYNYFFSLKGDLPKGLEVVYSYRKVIITGKPEEIGRFSFTVELEVDPPYSYDNGHYNDPLCENFTSKRYELVVR